MKHPAKPGSASAVRSPASCVVREEIAKATQTAQLLNSDLGSAFKAAEDPRLQIVLLRLMELTNELQTELTRVHSAAEEAC